MEIKSFFSHFCTVQHRLAVSPQAAALFFFLLGEFSNLKPDSDGVALANSRICGTIHISPAGLRKGRDELIRSGIITFTSADQGRTLALYTLCDTDEWKLDVVDCATDAADVTAPKVTASATPDSNSSESASANLPGTMRMPEIPGYQNPPEIPGLPNPSVISEPALNFSSIQPPQGFKMLPLTEWEAAAAQKTYSTLQEAMSQS